MSRVLQTFCVTLILSLSALIGWAQDESAAPAISKPELVVQLGQGSSVDFAAFSPDRRSILSVNANDSSAVLWDVATGAELRRFSGAAEEFHALAYSPDGHFVLTGGYDKAATLWNSATGAELQTFKGGMGPVLALAFSPDGRRVLTGNYSQYENGRKVAEEMVRVWDRASGKLVRSIVVQAPIKFSFDGRLVVTGGEGNTARVWDTNTGLEVKRFSCPNVVADAGFSPDGSMLWTSTGNAYDSQELRNLILWDVASGREIRRIEKTKAGRPNLSPNNRFLLMSADDEDFSVILIDIATGQEVKRFKNCLWGVGFSPDGSFVLTADSNNLRFWDLASGESVRVFRGYSSSVLSLSLSPDDRYVLVGSGNGAAQMWDTTTGQQVRQFVSEKGSVDYAALSADASFLFTHGFNNPGRIWNAATGEPLRSIYGHLKQTEAVALSPDGRYLLTGGFDNPARLWDPATGQEVRRLSGYPGTIHYVAFSPDSRLALTLSFDQTSSRTAILWDVATGKELRRFKVPIHMGSSVAISPDNGFMVIGGASPTYGNNANLFSLATGLHIRSFVGHSKTVASVTFSPDGRSILTGSWDQTARLWDVATGRQLRVFRGHSSMVWSARFSHDGRYIMSGSSDSTTRIWRADNAQEVCRLITLNSGDWIVVAPDGRFDTNNLDEIKGLNWVMPDDPYRPIPAEVFMRDYYEPRLLSKLFSGEKLPPIKSAADLNRVQPGVGIKQILWDGGHDKVSVSVEVNAASAEFTQDGRKVTLQTGVYDLRLFRDGQQVGYAPEGGGEIKVDPVTKKALVTFSGVKLPRQTDLTQVEFSAYAFNVDRVKSATARRAIVYPSDLTPTKGRAYLISIGVNAYENTEWNLKYAANDARQIQRTLTAKLSQNIDYSEIVPVSLLSDYQVKGNELTVSERTATKANIKAVLDLLAGKAVDPEIVKSIPNGDKLRAATPDDLVIISFSSHGYADNQGSFYFIPYDVGPGPKREINAELLSHCISSEELGLWLRDVDAGEMVMLVDACHSAAAIEGEGFRPGPMGSRGLGQLAYDKGMRILTSTQSDDVALETDFTQQGLLSYALTHDGIDAGQADFKPRDKQILLAEWLEYGVERVPKLYGEIETLTKNQQKNLPGQTKLVVFSRDGANSSLKKNANQQPALFDFTREKRVLVLSKLN